MSGKFVVLENMQHVHILDSFSQGFSQCHVSNNNNKIMIIKKPIQYIFYSNSKFVTLEEVMIGIHQTIMNADERQANFLGASEMDLKRSLVCWKSIIILGWITVTLQKTKLLHSSMKVQWDVKLLFLELLKTSIKYANHQGDLNKIPATPLPKMGQEGGATNIKWQ